MKTKNFFIIGILLFSFLFQSCDDDFTAINGQGSILTETLELSDFSNIAVLGVDDVHIQYGEEQKVEVRGHSNIINRIKRKVNNETWYVELEKGKYGHYELTYYITLPLIETISNSGTGNIYIDNDMSQKSIDIQLSGTGSFYGFSLSTENCNVSISGTGSAEITASSELDVSISGTGSVHYKGHPDLQSNTSGTGKIINAN